jgi:hypothetical protein
MMKALPLNQSQGINYEVTHDHLSQFFELMIFTTVNFENFQKHSRRLYDFKKIQKKIKN